MELETLIEELRAMVEEYDNRVIDDASDIIDELERKVKRYDRYITKKVESNETEERGVGGVVAGVSGHSKGKSKSKKKTLQLQGQTPQS